MLIIFFIILILLIGMNTNCNCKYKGGLDRVKNLVKKPRSKSEAEAIKILEKITNAKFPTIYPSWLVDNGVVMELDGYNSELGIAMEFSGPLHYKWYSTVESYDKYFNRIRRDRLKRKLCKKHGICLIVLEMTLNKSYWANYIQSRLYDCNKAEKPSNYLNKYKTQVYRNKVIEDELELKFDN